MSGHVFIIRGDLQRLACDAVVLPCDERVPDVNSVWQEFLPVGLPPVSRHKLAPPDEPSR